MQTSLEQSPLSRDHVVHFYDRDGELIALVVAQLALALRDGGAAVVIATDKHGLAVAEGLSQRGIDVDAMRTANLLVQLDAAETLAKLMVNGQPDPSDFKVVVGSVIQQLTSNGTPVFAFGEMVSLLWDRDQVLAALKLEELWNALMAETPFSLLCGYSAEQMAKGGDTVSIVEVCKLHSDVIGLSHGATYGTDASPAVSEGLLAIAVERRERQVWVRLSGELDFSTAPDIREVLVALNEERFDAILLDLSGLDFVDSTGLGLFVEEYKQAQQLEMELALVRPAPHLMRLLEITGLVGFFTIY